VAPEEITERSIYRLVSEPARIPEEGSALHPSDIDLVYFNGYGFPSSRGGPLHYADEIGLHNMQNEHSSSIGNPLSCSCTLQNRAVRFRLGAEIA